VVGQQRPGALSDGALLSLSKCLYPVGGLSLEAGARELERGRWVLLRSRRSVCGRDRLAVADGDAGKSNKASTRAGAPGVPQQPE